ncbi:hypothetical protein Tco_0957628, partial [Tanacetum coccineum]
VNRAFSYIKDRKAIGKFGFVTEWHRKFFMMKLQMISWMSASLREAGLRTSSKPSVLTTEAVAASYISHMSSTVAFNVSMPVGKAAMFAPEPGVQKTNSSGAVAYSSLHVPVYHNIDIEGAPDLQLSLSKLATLKLASPYPRPSIPQVLRMISKRIDEYDNANKRTANQ